MKLNETLFRVARLPGLHVLQEHAPGAAQELSSRRLCLEPGQKERFSGDDQEAALILQQGAGVLRCGGQSWRVSRAGVFVQPATGPQLD